PRAYAASGGATLGRSGGDGGGEAVELSSLIDALGRLRGTESMLGLGGFPGLSGGGGCGGRCRCRRVATTPDHRAEQRDQADRTIHVRKPERHREEEEQRDRGEARRSWR